MTVVVEWGGGLERIHTEGGFRVNAEIITDTGEARIRLNARYKLA